VTGWTLQRLVVAAVIAAALGVVNGVARSLYARRRETRRRFAARSTFHDETTIPPVTAHGCSEEH
jgi:hypothetical protein